jgi:hypothetical protein
VKWRRWTADEDALVRAMPPVVAAARTGRSLMAVRCRRRTLACGKRIRRWTAAEDELVRALRPADAAAATGRTAGAVYVRRRQLGAAVPRARPAPTGG